MYKKPTPAPLREARKLWRPKRKEMPEQCISCPFRTGNDAEFKAVLDKLVQANGGGFADPDQARFMIRKELTQMGGDFICHQSVYDKDMNRRDHREHRRCPGASAFHRNGSTSVTET